jgi:hypothetical protein
VSIQSVSQTDSVIFCIKMYAWWLWWWLSWWWQCQYPDSVGSTALFCIQRPCMFFIIAHVLKLSTSTILWPVFFFLSCWLDVAIFTGFCPSFMLFSDLFYDIATCCTPLQSTWPLFLFTCLVLITMSLFLMAHFSVVLTVIFLPSL